jgi:hypothetical protein
VFLGTGIRRRNVGTVTHTTSVLGTFTERSEITNNVSGTGVEKVESKVTYVSRLHIVKKGDGEGEGEGKGERGRQYSQKKWRG